MKKVSLFFLFCIVAFGLPAQVKVQALLTENLINPLSIDNLQPRFSWQLSGTVRNIRQSGYEIKVLNEKTTVWASGKRNSDQSVQVSYAGAELKSGHRYQWQVRVWDQAGKPSGWSAPAFFQMGLLTPADWKAKWIEPGYREDSILRPSPLLRKEFAAPKKIRSAMAYVTAHGLYEAFINNKRVGDAVLTPGWTSYNKRLQYQVYDVTNALQQGKNAIGVQLGSGWYRGNLAWGGHFNIYGKKTGLLFQLVVTYTDGTQEWINSDESWRSSTGSITYSEIYHGETIDARKEKKGWLLAGYDDKEWSPVLLAEKSNVPLIATENELVKKQEVFLPKKIITTPKGEKVIDFGQNLVGWVTVKINGRAGDTLRIRHAEVLDKKGNFYTDNLRAAKATATYISTGNGEEVFEPHFTFYGFRYIMIDGYAGELKAEDFSAVALYSAMPKAGNFTSSHPLLNQLQHNIQWGQNGNFLDVPTDCPQRDERLGWTGDAQAFAGTAAFNRNVNNFFAKWLKDVAADQRADGAVPHVVPNVLGDGSVASAGWADAATIIPWKMYMAYADTLLLKDQYPSMKAWVDYMRKQSKNDLWNNGWHFGDWLFYRPDDDNDGRAAVTDKQLIAQCFFTYSTQLLINAAQVLGKQEDVNSYTSTLQKIKDAFIKEYMTPNGRLVSSTQTAYVLALQFDMLPDALRQQAADWLAENVKSYGTHLTTGFLGTPYLCEVLSRFGHTDLAYKLLLQETYPSWLYPVKMGATTIWERWDGQKPDSSFQSVGMNSFNHYAYGAIGNWMYRTIAGIQEAAPGYKEILIHPVPGGNLTHAEATLQTYYGTISSSWKIAEGVFSLTVQIPANTSATVLLPAKEQAIIYEGNKAIESNATVKWENGVRYVALKIGSGIYQYSAK